MTTPWWTGLAPVDVAIECAGQEHHLRWAGGVFSAADHPDAERERTLAALGADPYQCLEIADLWQAHAEDLDVLVQASRGPADPLFADDESNGDPTRRSGVMYRGGWSPFRRAGRAGPGRATSFGWYGSPGGHPDEDDAPADGLTRLLRLGGGLPERLVATVLGTWNERNDTGDPRAAAAIPALEAALYGRFAAVVRAWLAVPAAIELVLIEPSHPPSLSRHDGGLRAELALTWLCDVWCRDLATIAGRLTLGAREISDGTWELLTIGPDLGPLRTMTLQL